MDIIEFCRRNDIANKLRAAIDDIENGNGYIVFDGLQDKGALVRVTYNGVNIVLSPGPLLIGFDKIPKVITQLPEKPVDRDTEFIEAANKAGVTVFRDGDALLTEPPYSTDSQAAKDVKNRRVPRIRRTST